MAIATPKPAPTTPRIKPIFEVVAICDRFIQMFKIAVCDLKI
jgi:hypothetical protein